MQASGSAYTFGLGKSGELGQGLQQDRELVPYRITQVRGVIQAAAGNGFTLILTDTGIVHAVGKAKDGRNGLPQDTTVPRPLPYLSNIREVACGYWHSAVIDTEGRLYATGHNKHGELGLGDTQDRPVFTLVPGVETVQRVVCGQHTTMLILAESSLPYTTGKTGVSGLPRDTANFRELPLGEAVVSLSCGTVHSAAVTVTGKLYTWGLGSFGQLGHGSHTSFDTPKEVEALRGVHVVQVSCSKGEKYGHSLCRDGDRNVYAWGSGYKGKLGLDEHWSHQDPADRLVPTAIAGFKADVVECGGIHSLAISDGQVFTWGCGSDGRLGHPECEGHRYLYKEPLPRPISLSATVTSVSSSYYHNVLVAH